MPLLLVLIGFGVPIFSSPVWAATEYRLGGADGNSWKASLSVDGGGEYVVLDADGAVIRREPVGTSSLSTGVDTLIDFSSANSIQSLSRLAVVIAGSTLAPAVWSKARLAERGGCALWRSRFSSRTSVVASTNLRSFTLASPQSIMELPRLGGHGVRYQGRVEGACRDRASGEDDPVIRGGEAMALASDTAFGTPPRSRPIRDPWKGTAVSSPVRGADDALNECTQLAERGIGVASEKEARDVRGKAEDG